MPSPSRLPAILVTIALVVALLTLQRLGSAGVCAPPEAAAGLFVQQMVEHGAILFPLANGHSQLDHPPLFPWTALLLDRVAGVTYVTAFNLRLPSALYAIVGALLTTAIASSFLAAGGAILTGLTLAATYPYIAGGRAGSSAMTLCFFTAVALFAFLLWYAPAPRPASGPAPASKAARGPGWLRYLLALALGLAVLAHGPTGAIILIVTFLIFMFAEGRLRDLCRLAAPGPLVLFLAAASSWYLASLFDHRYGLAFLEHQLGGFNLGRRSGPSAAPTLWSCVKMLLFSAIPLGCIAPIAVYSAIRTWFGPAVPPTIAASGPATAHRPAQNPLAVWDTLRMMVLPLMDPPATADALASSARAATAARLLAAFYLVTVTFFALATSRRPAFLLPLWPPAAFLLGWWLQRLAFNSTYGRATRRLFIAAASAAVLFNLLWLPHQETVACARDSFQDAAAHINRIVGRDEPLYLFALPDEPAALLFYLDRNAPSLTGKLGDAPPGYVIIPATKWNELKDEALTLEPVYTSTSGAYPLMLLHPGKTYATIR